MANDHWPEENRDNGENYYPPTNHPEDLPAYGQTPQWGEGAPGQQIPSGAADAGPSGGPHKIQVMEGFRWSLGAVFRSWQLWIPLGILYVLAVGGSSLWQELVSSGSEADMSVSAMSGLTTIIAFFVTPLVYNAALRNVDRGKAGWGDLKEEVNYGPILGMTIVSGIIPGIIGGIIALLGVVPVLNLLDQRSGGELDGVAIASITGVILLAVLVMFLIMPFFTFWPWVMVDRRAPFGEGIKLGYALGKANWGRLILFSICYGIVAFLAVLCTLGIAAVVVVPLQCLIEAHLYRQAVDGLSPETERDPAAPNR